MNVGRASTSSAVVLRVNGREVLTLGDCHRITQRRDPNSPFMLLYVLDLQFALPAQTLSLYYLCIANLTGYWALRTLPISCVPLACRYYVCHNCFPQ